MDTFDISDAHEPPRRKRSSGLVWNILTVLILVALICVVTIFLIIFIDPNSNLNPFPPPTLIPSIAAPTASVTLRFTLVPSWTPTNVLVLMADTPEPTHKPDITNTPFESPTSAVPIDTANPGAFAFGLQQGSPAAITGTTFHPDVGCNWSGIAGEATSLNGEAVKGLSVQLGGSMPDGAQMDRLIMTGSAPQYGPGGFEFTLAQNLVASSGTLWIQLLDQQNLPLSDRIYINTFDDCQKNLIIIYFVQVR
jgi:hypothetical protein